MKTDLLTTVIVAVFGVIIAYFVCNLFISENQDSFSFKTVDSSVSTSIADPNPEIFNYKALNPTVEVYVGSCREFNSNGVCIDGTTQIEQGIIEETDEELEELENTSDTNSNSSNSTRTSNSSNSSNSSSSSSTSNQRNP